MKRFLKITGVIGALVVVVALVGATAALAQGPGQSDTFTPPGRAQMQRGAGAGLRVMAVDQDEMHDAIAEALGISLAELEAARAEGKTLFVLAQELGVDFTEVREAMSAVHEASLEQAVTDGTISQEQADWMLSRLGGQGGQASGMGRGFGGGLAQGMGRGAGNGGFGGFGGECPYQAP
jgi:hypothetical protein